MLLVRPNSADERYRKNIQGSPQAAQVKVQPPVPPRAAETIANGNTPIAVQPAMQRPMEPQVTTTTKMADRQLLIPPLVTLPFSVALLFPITSSFQVVLTGWSLSRSLSGLCICSSGVLLATVDFCSCVYYLFPLANSLLASVLAEFFHSVEKCGCCSLSLTDDIVDLF
ncbi:unnamed protein product [Oncorhynchus mykiss]|uniref:Uncharacterized protein n=1 Tax=Oncorhynchus mykiss TaxID=8022 RepID=A0A060X3V3_ONCMY|nr:unnamed protein product [Oncorhynchus mykiss]